MKFSFLSARIKMARSLAKLILFVAKRTVFRPIHEPKSTLHHEFGNQYHRCFCTNIEPGKLCWAGSSHANLLKRLEIALNDHRFDEAWEAYNDFKALYGKIPDGNVMIRLVTELSYSSEPKWLEKGFNLVLSLVKQNPNLIRVDLLTKILLVLARAQMPVPASVILRLMLEKESLGLPRGDIVSLVVLHMVKTEVGTNIASNILFEICENFQRLSLNKKSSCVKMSKPDTLIFNLVLDACVRFKSSFKGQQIVELMAQVGVLADAYTIVIIARIHEMNDQRDELRKFQDYVDQVSTPLLDHYCQFYDSLLSLHFRFNDVDAASKLMYDMNRCRGSLALSSFELRNGQEKPYLIPIGSRNLRVGLKLQILPHLLQKDSVLKVENDQDLLMYKSGKLVLHDKALAKLIVQYKRQGRISDLSKLLICIQKKSGSSAADSLCFYVISACIHVGWLETAHDMLDDLEQEGILLSGRVYTSLLTAYNEGNMFREAEALLKQVKKAGFNICDRKIVSECSCTLKDISTNSALAMHLVREMRELEKVVQPALVYELNSSIYFFTKAKMIDDALKTYRRMAELNACPIVSTFIYLIHGYSSLEMYREITILWGDIKRNSGNENPIVNRDLYELLLISFLKGGYFERVMEVIGCMKKYCMFSDKWLYKSMFLKLHKDLYRNLKSSNAKSEAQRKRLEHVQAFRKWVGIG